MSPTHNVHNMLWLPSSTYLRLLQHGLHLEENNINKKTVNDFKKNKKRIAS